MAGFDPQVQSMGDNPFIYGFGARPIQEPKPNQAGEIAGKTIGKALGETGNIIKEGADLASNVTSDNIKTDLHNQYDPVQNNYINRLSQVDDVLKKHPDVLDLSQKQYPSDIQKLPGMVDNLIALRDNGKISSVYIDMQKDAIAKSIRAQHPGFRDVIDQEFSRMTREDPSNKVATQLQEDINAYASAARAKKDQIGTALLTGVKEGLVDPGTYFGYVNKKVPAEVALGSMYQQAKMRADLKLDDLQMGNQIKRNQLNKEAASQRNSDYLGKQAVASLDKLHVSIPGFQSDKIGDVLSKLYAGNDPNIEQDSRMVATMVAGAKAAYIANMTAEGNKPFDPEDPKSLSRSAVEGADSFQKNIESASKPFDVIIKALADKDYGSAYAAINHSHALMDEEGRRVLEADPNMGIIGAVNKLAPQYMGKLTTALIPDVQLTPTQQAYVLQNTGKAIAPTPELKASGIQFNLGTAMDEAAQKKANGPEYASANAAIISGVQRVLTDPNAPLEMKQNAANFLFGDENALDRFNSSAVNRGKVLPGKSTVLANTVNTKTTQEVKKLADPEVTQKYITFAKKSVGNTIFPEISQLNKLQDNKDFKISWDTDKNQFRFDVVPQGAGVNPGARIRKPDYYNQVNDSVTKINLALRSLIEVNQKLTHENVSDFLAEFFINSGMNPELIRGTVGGQFIEALIASQKKTQGP